MTRRFPATARAMPNRAFTLLELLSVIAIIAVLAALAFPVFSSVKMQGNQTACASNQRQIGAGLLAYANEHDGELPETTHTTGVKFQRAWIYTLKPYLANVDQVRICPADPRGADRLKANGTSYVLNSYIFVPGIGPFGESLGSLNNVRKLPYATRTLIAFNVSDEQGASVMNDHTHSDAWTGNWRRVRADIEPNRFRTGASNAEHTNGSANYLYLDGHVENLPGETLHQQIDRGVPVGKPPLLPEEISSL